MRAARRVAVALGVAATSVLVTAGPADAHDAAITRSCGTVTVSLLGFRSSAQAPNAVELRRNGVKIDTIGFRGAGSQRTYPETSTTPVTYEVSWRRTGPDKHTGGQRVTLPPPTGCPAPAGVEPSASSSPSPTASSSPTATPVGSAADSAAAAPAPPRTGPSWWARQAPYVAGFVAVWLPIGAALGVLALIRRHRRREVAPPADQ